MPLLIKGFPDNGQCLHDLVARFYGKHRILSPLYYTIGGITHAVLNSEDPEYWCKRLGPDWGNYLMSVVEEQRESVQEEKRIKAGGQPKMVLNLPLKEYKRMNDMRAKQWRQENYCQKRREQVKSTQKKGRLAGEMHTSVDYAGPIFRGVVWDKPIRENYVHEDDYDEACWIWISQFAAEVMHSHDRYVADQTDVGER